MHGGNLQSPICKHGLSTSSPVTWQLVGKQRSGNVAHGEMVSNFACWVSVEQKQKEGVVACGHTLPALSLQTAQELGDL